MLDKARLFLLSTSSQCQSQILRRRCRRLLRTTAGMPGRHGYCRSISPCCFRQGPRLFSSASNHSSSSNSNGSSGEQTVMASCDVVQGPSLLRTAVHRPRPSLLFLPGLRSLPFWTRWDEEAGVNRVAYGDPSVTRAVEQLQQHADIILEEYRKQSKVFPSDYEMSKDEKSLHEGTWDWRSYMLKGKLQGHFVATFPQTAMVLQQLREQGLLFEGVPFGYAFYSTLHGESRISPHTSPMNFRLRVHLPLIVPNEENEDSTKHNNEKQFACGIRVGAQTRRWETGKALVLDDSFEHEAWNSNSKTEEKNNERVVLLVDLWHPDVSPEERAAIVEMFQLAKEKGMWSNK